MAKRRYDLEFKREAVRLVVEDGRSIRSVEESLGITPGVLKDWVVMFREHGNEAFIGSGNLHPEDARVRSLEKELTRVTRERDILKKAVAIFSRDPNPYLDS
jgi:transposase